MNPRPEGQAPGLSVASSGRRLRPGERLDQRRALLLRLRRLVEERDAALRAKAKAERIVAAERRRHCVLCGLPTHGQPYCHAHSDLGGGDL